MRRTTRGTMCALTAAMMAALAVVGSMSSERRADRGRGGAGEVAQEAPSALRQATEGAHVSPGRRAFVINRGQWDAAVTFVARRGAEAAFFGPNAITLTRACDARRVAVRLAFEAASRDATLEGVGRQAGLHNFFLGDRDRWRTGVEGFDAIRYRRLYAGIDVLVREHDGHLEYDVEVAPLGSLDAVAIRVDGARDVRVRDDGSLVIDTALGAIAQPVPTTWEVTDDGERRPVACRYRILGPNRYGFVAPDRDPALALVVDPGIEWSTFIGGSQNDYANDIAIDATGHVIVAGQTTSSSFPTTTGAYDTRFGGNGDAVVCKLDPTGSTLVWSTYLGGSSSELGKTVDVLANGDVVVSGLTQSSNFPTTAGAYDRTHNGNADAFVCKLTAAGNALVFSTFLGGASYDEPFGLAIDAAGGIVIGGLTQSANFPTTAGAYDATANGQDDGFVARLDANGATLVASTYLGGNGDDPVEDVVVDASGVVTVCGQTWAVNNVTTFPTTPGAYDTTYNGGKSDTYVARLDAGLTRLVYSTFLGGTNWDPSYALHLHPNGAVTVAGQTYSANFPATAGAVQATYGGMGDVYLARFDPTGATLQYATFLGGSDFDEGRALAVDSAGTMTVTGWTRSTNYPTTTGAYASTNRGMGDNYVSRVSPDGTRLYYSSLFGGTKWDEARAIALDGTGAATIAGQGWSNDYPTTAGAYDPTYNSNGDVFVTRLDLLPTGVAKRGRSAASCLGPIALGVTESPTGGAQSFRITSTNGPPSTAGLLILGFAPLQSGLPLDGAELWLSPFAPYVSFLMNANANGFASYRIPVPASGRGATVHFQAIWPKPAGCTGPGNLRSSNALAVTIQ